MISGSISESDSVLHLHLRDKFTGRRPRGVGINCLVALQPGRLGAIKYCPESQSLDITNFQLHSSCGVEYGPEFVKRALMYLLQKLSLLYHHIEPLLLPCFGEKS